MFEKRDVHIHVPDGATPKDGPSAGAAMTTAFVSALTGIPVRAHVAMTGEITLRGEVTAIGGLKEKLLAARRGGIKTVLIPQDNVKDLQEIPENVKNQLEIVPVKWIDQVLEHALEAAPQALPDEEPAKAGRAGRRGAGAAGRRRPDPLSRRGGGRARAPPTCRYTCGLRRRGLRAPVERCGSSSVGRAQPCQG